ncbi:MAG: hypothetical protein IIX43_01925 [Bacteroidales bacterium]|nr:hypothetical protein [Bacteroidales bacterium]
MKNTRLSKFVLVADLLICTLFFFLLLHKELMNYEINMLLVSVPLLRMWLGFLTYSKSKLGAVPLVILSLITLCAFLDVRDGVFASTLFVQPLYMLISKFSHLIGIQDMIQVQFFINDLQYYTSEITILCSIWLVGIPLTMYLYRLFKKQLQPSGLSIWKSVGLGVYIFVAIIISLILKELPVYSISLFVLLILLTLIPIIFYRGKFKGLLACHELVFLIALTMLIVCYAFALSVGEVTVIMACLFPIAFYTLANWYYGRKIGVKEIAFVVASSVIFSFAQYTIGIVRIILCLGSMFLMAVALFRFAKATNRKCVSVFLYVFIAIIVPVLSIGYNPYSVLNAGRLTRFDDYSYSENGILFVWGKDGYGLRDRYKMILPAEYDYIEILAPSKPYCKVRKDSKYRVYDIEQHELVSEEWFDDIVACGEHVYRLKSENAEMYLVMPKRYNRNGEMQKVIITNQMPLSKME